MSIQQHSQAWLAWWMSLCAAIVCAPTGAIYSQIIAPWDPTFERPFRSMIEPWILERFDEVLVLSVEQEGALRRIYERHNDRFAAFVDEYAPVKARLDNAVRLARSQSDSERYKMQLQREEELEPIANLQAKLDGQFFEEARQVPLTEEQEDRWQAAMREIHRELWTGNCLYVEGRFDLITLLDKIVEENSTSENSAREEGPFKPGPDLQEVLMQYEIEFDIALRRRVEQSVEQARNLLRDRSKLMRTDGKRVWMGEPETKDELRDVGRREREKGLIHRSLRDINRRYRDIIAAMLPNELRSLFVEKYNERALEDLLRDKELRGEKFVKDVESLLDLNEDQRAAVTEYIALYARQKRIRNREIIEAQGRVKDASSHLAPIEKLSERYDQLNRTVEERVELDAELIQNVRSLLLPAQRATIKGRTPSKAVETKTSD